MKCMVNISPDDVRRRKFQQRELDLHALVSDVSVPICQLPHGYFLRLGKFCQWRLRSVDPTFSSFPVASQCRLSATNRRDARHHLPRPLFLSLRRSLHRYRREEPLHKPRSGHHPCVPPTSRCRRVLPRSGRLPPGSQTREHPHQ